MTTSSRIVYLSYKMEENKVTVEHYKCLWPHQTRDSQTFQSLKKINK